MEIISDTPNKRVITCPYCHYNLKYCISDIICDYLNGHNYIVCPICNKKIFCEDNNLINILNIYH